VEAVKGLVSIVLPVRLWSSHTAKAINSILQQSYTNIELLLIGQGCLTSLYKGLDSTGINDKRISLISRKSPGIVSALNTGLRLARGEFIARMDDDDIAYPDRLELQISYLRNHPHIGPCAGGIRFIDKQGDTRAVGADNQRYAQWLNEHSRPETIALACYAENPMPHPTLLATRTVWEALGEYRDVDAPEDHDLILRAMLAGIGMGKPPGIVLDWREHEARLTHNDQRYRRQGFVALSAQAVAHDSGPLAGNPRRDVWIAGTGKNARIWHDELTALNVAVQGFVDMRRPGPTRSKRERSVITYEQLLRLRTNELVISAVSQPAGRDAIKKFCHAQNWQEGSDFILGC